MGLSLLLDRPAPFQCTCVDVIVHACGSSSNTILRAHIVARAEFRMGVSDRFCVGIGFAFPQSLRTRVNVQEVECVKNLGDINRSTYILKCLKEY